MKAEELYRELGEKSSPDDIVAILDDTLVPMKVTRVEREVDPDTKQGTIWLTAVAL